MHQSTIQSASFLIVTGYSGAGKTTVLRALEDSGFFCVDNLPLNLLYALYQVHIKTPGQRMALGLDVRSSTSAQQLVQELRRFKEQTPGNIAIFFVRSSTRILLRRFQETRRKHPLAEQMQLTDAIIYEKELLRPVKKIADLSLETDQLTMHQLRNFVRDSFAQGGSHTMLVSLVSFGFKYGVPVESNFVYDLRSLPNPYFIPELRPLKGTDQPILDYLFKEPEVIEYWTKFNDFVRYSIDKTYQEGRSFMKIAIGCTGGRHRSVAFVHTLAQQKHEHVQFLVEHRDLFHDVYKKS
ncbi:MAG TPA: RNase adapter RapZ [Candidatus Limnocylindria bacterium]|nr:RNase adapter RapZ [Candidatus Limnocylindria bacterium]